MIAELFLVCALALPANGQIHPLTDEAKFFEFLKTYDGSPITVINRPWQHMRVIQQLRNASGLVLLESDFGQLRAFFNHDGWTLLPFHYGHYEIYERSA